jgi:hypothetical protein
MQFLNQRQGEPKSPIYLCLIKLIQNQQSKIQNVEIRNPWPRPFPGSLCLHYLPILRLPVLTAMMLSRRKRETSPTRRGLTNGWNYVQFGSEINILNHHSEKEEK